MKSAISKLVATLTPVEKARMILVNREPALALYRVALEGVSGGAVVGLGRLPKIWHANAVEQLASLMDRRNLPVYRGHGRPGERRAPIGRIVRCITNKENGAANAYALVHVVEPASIEAVAKNTLDVASIEAELALEAGNDGWEVKNVEQVTGLALADSQSSTPGFSGATLVAFTQESLDDVPVAAQPQDGAPASAYNEPNDIAGTIERELAGKNLSQAERDFVLRRITARLPLDCSRDQVRHEVGHMMKDIEEMKRIYRRPVYAAAPAEKPRGPVSLTNPEHNELIPR